MTVMNVFTLWQSRYGEYELVTPRADGTILNGVTRQTIIDMAEQIKEKFNVTVREGKISIHEVIEADKEGRLVEMFGASTHCPLMPIKRVCYKDTTMILGQHEIKKD